MKRRVNSSTVSLRALRRSRKRCVTSSTALLRALRGSRWLEEVHAFYGDGQESCGPEHFDETCDECLGFALALATNKSVLTLERWNFPAKLCGAAAEALKQNTVLKSFELGTINLGWSADGGVCDNIALAMADALKRNTVLQHFVFRLPKSGEKMVFGWPMHSSRTPY